jgi:hypothetical protein
MTPALGRLRQENQPRLHIDTLSENQIKSNPRNIKKEIEVARLGFFSAEISRGVRLPLLFRWQTLEAFERLHHCSFKVYSSFIN